MDNKDNTMNKEYKGKESYKPGKKVFKYTRKERRL